MHSFVNQFKMCIISKIVADKLLSLHTTIKIGFDIMPLGETMVQNQE